MIVIAGLGALGGMLGLGFGLMWFMGTQPPRRQQSDPVNVNVNLTLNGSRLEPPKVTTELAPPRFHQIHARPIPKHSGRPEIGRGR